MKEEKEDKKKNGEGLRLYQHHYKASEWKHLGSGTCRVTDQCTRRGTVEIDASPYGHPEHDKGCISNHWAKIDCLINGPGTAG